jgi:hypothetical protein
MEANMSIVYLGDSASLSYLDTFRRLVETTLGPSNFTRDENKYKLLERPISTDSRPTHVLPDREAAEFLLDSFFSNVSIWTRIFENDRIGAYTSHRQLESSTYSTERNMAMRSPQYIRTRWKQSNPASQY